MKTTFEIIDKVNPTIKLNDGTEVKTRILETASGRFWLQTPDGKRLPINLYETPVYKVVKRERGCSIDYTYLDEQSAKRHYKTIVNKFYNLSKEKTRYVKYRYEEEPLFKGSFSRWTEFSIDYTALNISSLFVRVELFKYIKKQN